MGECFKENFEDVFDATHFREIDSTHTYVENNFQTFATNKFTMISADSQTKGRGTGSRSWVSSHNQSLLTTFHFTLPQSLLHQAATLTQILSLSSIAIMRKHVGALFSNVAVPSSHFGLKWANDLILNDKKIGGVLARTVEDPRSGFGVIISVGINIKNREQLLSGIDRPIWPASSLFIEFGSKVDDIDMSAFRRDLAKEFFDNLHIHVTKGGYCNFRSAVDELLILRGEEVNFSLGTGSVSNAAVIKGVVDGISETGALVLVQDGVKSEQISGEIMKK